MSQLKLLQGATDIYGLAGLLGFQPAMLAFVLYGMEPNAKYRMFDIPKRNGGTRTIAAPIEQLKLLQSRLSNLLQNCVDEIADSKSRRDNCSHGFTRKRSIITNARVHRRRRWVFNADIPDFFGSINFGRVRGLLRKNRDIALQPAVATVLAQIACHKNSLPQGSPCSPVLSNLVGHILDIRLIQLAHTYGCTYTRYADDLTFSTNKREFPLSLATQSTGPHAWVAGLELANVIAASGFALNPSKTRMQYRNSRQEVTGLIVNAKVNVRAEYRHTVRAMVHRLLKTGSYELVKKTKDLLGNAAVTKSPGELDQLHGMLAFIDGVDLMNKGLPRPSGTTPKSLSSKENMYRQFLLYKDFYAAKTPVVLCEGATDNVYLVHAIRHLAVQYPDLAEIDSKGKIKLTIRLYKCSKSSTGRILGIKGGTGDLKNWMGRYEMAMRRFKAPGKENPVIVVVDNDDGAKGIWSFIEGITKKKPSPTDFCTHVRGNLYVTAIPSGAGNQTAAIESCFDAATLAIKVEGKTFNSTKSFDDKLHFGKVVFAHKVVTPNASKIDFKGFGPLLTNVVATIADHKKRYPASP
jgi:RNA-directed DNA polymerase